MTFVQATYVPETFVLFRNILVVTDPILTKLFGPNILQALVFVKLRTKLNSPVQVGQGVDFVFPLSQEQQQQEQEQEPSPKSTITKCTTDLTHKTKTLPTIPWMITHHPKVGHPPS